LYNKIKTITVPNPDFKTDYERMKIKPSTSLSVYLYVWLPFLYIQLSGLSNLMSNLSQVNSVIALLYIIQRTQCT